MNFLTYKHCIKTLLGKYKSCSLVNAEGSLLFSKDQNFEVLTTTRLVAFQIVKKYLNPKPQDFFLLNDPENGGYQLSKLIFISCLSPNLFLIWDENNFNVDFKIPPTPIFDQGVKNEFVWQALIGSRPYSAEFESFLEYQKYKVDTVLKSASLLKTIGDIKAQQQWLKATQNIFDTQFNNKAQGSTEAQYKLSSGSCIRLRFSAEEKQNLKMLTLDFTNTNICPDIYTSSHVIESVLIKKIIDFYSVNEFFTQAILDKIKIILPPKSIVSRSHPTGEHNFELQTICSQLCDYNLTQLNLHTRKSKQTFELTNFLYFSLYSDHYHSNNFVGSDKIQLEQFEDLINNKVIDLKKMKRTDNLNQICFDIQSAEKVSLTIKNNYKSDEAAHELKLNNESIGRGQYELKQGDQLEILWKYL